MPKEVIEIIENHREVLSQVNEKGYLTDILGHPVLQAFQSWCLWMLLDPEKHVPKVGGSFGAWRWPQCTLEFDHSG
jgi:hypothetical protein